MRITALELVDFRNYAAASVAVDAGLTVLVGPNAAGKTNMLEAVQLLTATVSFRNPRWSDLVRWGSERTRATLRAEDERGTPMETSLEIGPDGKRVYRLNGNVKRRVVDLLGVMPSVLFNPDDLDLVKGSSERRRDEVDDLGGQLSKTYAAVRRDYARVVRQRNSLLKDERTTSGDLEPWDDQLVSLGAKLSVHRRRLAERIATQASEAYERLAGGERLSVTYVEKAAAGTQEPDEAAAVRALRTALEATRREERARGTTVVGPHRDDLVFSVDDRDARTFASQGQQRTIALAWKLAEVRVVEEVARRKPVLLLDDVMSELDESRRSALTALVEEDVQTIVTTTNLGYFDRELLDRATIVEVGR